MALDSRMLPARSMPEIEEDLNRILALIDAIDDRVEALEEDASTD